MTEPACTCGHQPPGGETLADHLGEIFIPANDIAADGQAHAQATSDPPASGTAPAILRCLCGFTGTAPEIDGHLLAAFIPDDATDRAGVQHAPAC